MQSRLATYTKGRSQIHESILDTIGKTPILQLRRILDPSSSCILQKNNVKVFVKLECENPGGSLKDRLATGIIEFAEARGLLQPGQTVVEASSGNTGIGLAMVCAAKGYPLVCVMSEAFSVERRKLMRFFGARVVLTNPAHKVRLVLINFILFGIYVQYAVLCILSYL